MFCIHCGSELRDDARFCTNCGSAVDKTEDSTSSATAADQLPRDGAKQDDSPSSNGEKPQTGEPASAHGDSPVKSAIGSAKRRSVSAVRMIALVALAVALAAGAAYAAYRVYADVWLPSQQAQQEVQEEAAPEQPAEEDDSEYDAAMAAYQGVLDEYREFAIEQKESRGNGQYDWSDKHPDLNWEVVGKLDQPQYCFKDLNSDGIPELLVGSENCILDIASYADGKPIHLYYGTLRGHAFLCEDSVVGFYGTGGATTGSREYKRLDASLADVSYSVSSNYDSGTNFNTIESISWNGVRERLTVDIIHSDGSSESKSIILDELTPMVNTFEEKYPLDTSADWQPL